MALAKDLPIHKVCYDLLSLSLLFVKNMPRSLRKPVGDRLLDRSEDLLELVYEANKAQFKRPLIETLLRRLQRLEILLRQCRDLRLISDKQYARAVELSESIGKQATKWRNSSVPSPAT